MKQTRFLALFVSFACTSLVGCTTETSGEPGKTPETDKTPRPEKTPADDPGTPPDTPDDSCQWALDGECDDPEFCAPGTDVSDCSGVPVPDNDTCQYANDGVCDDPQYCAPGTDATDCSISDPPSDDSCQYANDNECDEPDLCAFGTDTSDCENAPGPGEDSIAFTVNVIGFDVSSTPVVVSGNSSDADTTIQCLYGAVDGRIFVNATVGDHEIRLDVSSLSAAETCVYNEGDFDDFTYFTPNYGEFYIAQVNGYGLSSNFDCTDTGVNGDYIDLRFSGDDGLYINGDPDDGLGTRVEITDGVLRCHW